MNSIGPTWTQPFCSLVIVGAVLFLVPSCGNEGQVCSDWNSPAFFQDSERDVRDRCLRVGNLRETDAWGNGPIHASTMDATGESFELLLGRGANPNQPGHRGATPLMYAVAASWPGDILRRAVAVGADPERADDSGETALFWSLKLGRDEQFAALLEAGSSGNAISNEGVTPLYLAVEARRLDWVERLLQHGAHPNGDPRRNPLHAAVKAEVIDIASALIAAGADANGGHASPLVSAAAGGQLALLDLLVAAGADVNRADWRDWYPIEAAEREDVVGWLLEKGAVVPTHRQRMTVLHWLMLNDEPSLAILERLLAAGADPRAADRRGNEPLHFLAGLEDTGVVRRLLRGGANALAANEFGVTPLHLAAFGGSREVLVLLLHTTSPRVNPKDIRGQTPLHYAAVGDRPLSIVEALLRAGAAAKLRDHGNRTAHDLAEYWSSDPAVVQRLANAR